MSKPVYITIHLWKRNWRGIKKSIFPILYTTSSWLFQFVLKDRFGCFSRLNRHFTVDDADIPYVCLRTPKDAAKPVHYPPLLATKNFWSERDCKDTAKFWTGKIFKQNFQRFFQNFPERWWLLIFFRNTVLFSQRGCKGRYFYYTIQTLFDNILNYFFIKFF